MRSFLLLCLVSAVAITAQARRGRPELPPKWAIDSAIDNEEFVDKAFRCLMGATCDIPGGKLIRRKSTQIFHAILKVFRHLTLTQPSLA